MASAVPRIVGSSLESEETAIVGESLAGLFAVETFLLEPELFDTYIAIDPSLWWNDRGLVKGAAERLRSRPKLEKTLYLANSDEKEIAAIREVFGKAVPPISSTKSLTGHSLGAIGVQEAIFSLLMMQGGFIAESAHIEELDPAFNDIPIARKRIDNAAIDCVMSNSFGFGGTNATLVFQRYNG